MRAAEFMRALADVIDTLDGKSSNNQPAKDPNELEQNPIMVPPLQQQIELQKAEAGKDSPVIQDLIQDEEEPEEETPQEIGDPRKSLFRIK
jgi:hypothetical protein